MSVTWNASQRTRNARTRSVNWLFVCAALTYTVLGATVLIVALWLGTLTLRALGVHVTGMPW